LTVREIADLVAAGCQINMSTSSAVNAALVTIRAVLARPHEGLTREKRGKEPMLYRVGDR
jgi:hypothetical protein